MCFCFGKHSMSDADTCFCLGEVCIKLQKRDWKAVKSPKEKYVYLQYVYYMSLPRCEIFVGKIACVRSIIPMAEKLTRCN